VSLVSEFFEQLPTRVDPGKSAGLNNSYVFAIDGAGTWTVKVADGGVTVDEGDTGGDCTISTSAGPTLSPSGPPFDASRRTGAPPR